MNKARNVYIVYGQKNNCMYYYLITKNSIEEKIFETLKQRKDYMRNVTTDSFYEYHIQQIPGYMLFSLKYNFNIQP